MTDYADSLQNQTQQNEAPPCECNHSKYDHVEDANGFFNCLDCACMDYRPLDAEDVLDKEGLI